MEGQKWFRLLEFGGQGGKWRMDGKKAFFFSIFKKFVDGGSKTRSVNVGGIVLHGDLWYCEGSHVGVWRASSVIN